MGDTEPTSGLWTPHSVEETLEIYANWAANYDADVRDMGYVTPGRIAMALRQAGASVSKPVLDFGCGTGLSGIALKSVGFDIVDGTDISAEMLAQAEAKGVYRQVWKGEPGTLGHIRRGDYATIAAVGVVSLGAAPSETLTMLAGALGPAGLLAFSFNEPTLAAPDYTGALAALLADPAYELVFEANGPHLPAKAMSSTVYVLRRV